MATITPQTLGSQAFRRDYGIRYAYIAGAMYRAIASKEMVVALGNAGLVGYFGTGGLRCAEIETAIERIRCELRPGCTFGMNLLSSPERPALERETVDLYLRHDVRKIEAAAFMSMTANLVVYRLTGLCRDSRGELQARHRILAKVSRPEVAAAFMQPPPAAMVGDLLASGRISRSEAELSQYLPVSGEICVESDSGGHTDRGVAQVLLPVMLGLRDEMQQQYRYGSRICVGAAGGIGTPPAAAAAFVMGADFVLTGSINQCTVEAGTSEPVKDLLQEMDIQDTAHVPAGDMFEIGAKVQVAKRGLFFPARASKLYELYQRYASLDEIDPATRRQLEDQYFKRSLADVWAEASAHLQKENPRYYAEVQNSPRKKMAHIFKWYFALSTRLAMQGIPERKVDFQIHCGPALGAFNRWVKGTDLQAWRNRRVADLAERMMCGTADVLQQRLRDAA